MRAATCREPIPWAALVDYWSGELSPDEEERIEMHLIGCTHCSEQLGGLAQLDAGIGSAFRRGLIPTVITPTILQQMQQDGLRVREYRVAPGGSVNCTIGAGDDAVVSRLQATLDGAIRVDLVHEDSLGAGRLRDIPFAAASGEVLYCPSASALKQAPAHVATIRLLAVDQAGEYPLAEYTFVHTPS